MEVSQGADEIYKEARLNPQDRQQIVLLIEKHGVEVAAELIALLVQVVAQNSGIPSFPRAR